MQLIVYSDAEDAKLQGQIDDLVPEIESRISEG